MPHYVIHNEQELAEYFNKVEAYTNYEDGFTSLMEKLHQRACRKGLVTFTKNERTFYTIGLYLEALNSMGLDWFFDSQDDTVQDKVAAGLSELGTLQMQASFRDARAIAANPMMSFTGEDEAECMEPFFSDKIDFFTFMEQWAAQQGLLESTART